MTEINFAMKARPMLFSDSIVLAVLDDSKSQTRRNESRRPRARRFALACTTRALTTGTASSSAALKSLVADMQDSEWTLPCPHVQPGEQLWVREAYADAGCGLTYRADLGDYANTGWELSVVNLYSDRERASSAARLRQTEEKRSKSVRFQISYLSASMRQKIYNLIILLVARELEECRSGGADRMKEGQAVEVAAAPITPYSAFLSGQVGGK